MIDLIYPVGFANHDPNLISGVLNPGGGMPTKTLSVISVLSKRYKLNLIDSFADRKNDIIVIEPLTPRLLDQDLDQWVEDLHACDAKKILYCSEMEVNRWSPNLLTRILEGVDIVTANTKYQESLIRTLSNGERHPFYLCDPIDESLFRPAKDKKLRVFSAGRVSKDKNTHFLVDVFSKIKKTWGELVEVAYFGAANLWGHETPEDLEIQRNLEQVCDVFRGGMRRNEVASLFGESLIFIAKSKHDVYSSTHAEILSAGCISVGGGHPLYQERPGISGLREADEFVDAIGELLDLKESEIKQASQESRDYILQNCGFEAFLGQFERIMGELI